MDITREPILVFYSYEENDEDLCKLLDQHLANLKDQNLIKPWDKRQILAGTDRQSAINEHLDAAQIILLLISPDFIASDHCYGQEAQRALRRHNKGEAFVMPVLLRYCDIHETPLIELDLLPSNEEPIKSWDDTDKAFLDVVQGIRDVVDGFRLESGGVKTLRQVVSGFRQRSKEEWVDEGKRYTREKRYEKALVAYGRALRIDGKYARAYRYKGEALFLLERYADASLAFEQAIKLNPQFAYAWNNKGNALSRLKRYDEAVAAYEQTSQLDPTFALPHNNRGRALYHLGRYQESLMAYDRALQLDPNLTLSQKNRAETLKKLSE